MPRISWTTRRAWSAWPAQASIESRTVWRSATEGAPGRGGLAPRAADPVTGNRLWELSEELTSVRFGLPATG
ncbi:hypothetical protein [Streptomyces sp. CAI 127]|uniref:hypothetical protein n=1 Tax=Streptomyces sp. CAI 127 TaxID=1076397 RepID=UPI0035CB3D16